MDKDLISIWSGDLNSPGDTVIHVILDDDSDYMGLIVSGPKNGWGTKAYKTLEELYAVLIRYGFTQKENYL